MEGVSRGVAYVRQAFGLLELPDGQWQASWAGVGVIVGERALVVAAARRRWGHMNHADEARAFDEIFR